MLQYSLPPPFRARGVTALLGPTNTGKTFYAIERMVSHESGIIGLPLRLLAREVYQRVVERVGVKKVALITGEEKIKPDYPRYWVCTVEAMPRDIKAAFVAIDEVQLAADTERGHVFTDRILNHRGLSETLLLGSPIICPLLYDLIPGLQVTSRPRLSQLNYNGAKKLSRLPERSAIVAFSVEEVYAVAELIRRQKGGAAVVLGALSPRTRNAQVELYQSGEVDYLVATDAIGMGLNLDVQHVAFASDRKFDGSRFRPLYPAELAQIAGRAGRHIHDGTFGSTGRCPPFEAETIEAIENNIFEPLHVLQWRNPELNFSNLDSLKKSLEKFPQEKGLTRAMTREDMLALETLSNDSDIRRVVTTPKLVETLWETCQIPDYRKLSPQAHADLVQTIFQFIYSEKYIPTDWFEKKISKLNRTDGDLDTLANRISQVRTWSFIANHPDWIHDSSYWQALTRKVEDTLSDALHLQLAQRFIDRRTSILLRRLRENKMLDAEITTSGDIIVEGQHIGTLAGFFFTPDPGAAPEEIRTLRQAAQNALANELNARADLFAETADSNLVLSLDGTIRWLGAPIAKLEAGEKVLEPRFRLIVDEVLTPAAQEKIKTRLDAWLKAYIIRQLEPLFQLENAADLEGIARGIAYQLFEGLGILERAKVLQDVRNLTQEERTALRRLGVRFGAYHLFLPALLKPAPRLLAAQLWGLSHGGLEQKGLDDIALLANSGRTSFPQDPDIAQELYRAAGFLLTGKRALRVDILERLADLVRPAIAYQPGITAGEAPAGAADGDSFVPTVAMTSLVGCAGEDFAEILRSLGYISETRPGPAITAPLLEPAAIEALEKTDNSGTSSTEVPPPATVSDVPATSQESTETILTEAIQNDITENQSEVISEENLPIASEITSPIGEVETELGTKVETELGAKVEDQTEPEPQMIEVWRIQKKTYSKFRPKKPEESEGKPRKFNPKFSRTEAGSTPQNSDPTSGEAGKSSKGRNFKKYQSFNLSSKGKERFKDGSSSSKKPFDKTDTGKNYPRKLKEPDMDSPFAKLLALKDQLDDPKKK